VPEKDLWVNLSPYEPDRIIPEAFGRTEMGRDLLAQDYILKQLTASLSHPEKKLGRDFWDRVYARLAEEGITDISPDIFNKVWIMPDRAAVYEKGTNVFVVENTLKVMMEEDYLALANNKVGIVDEDMVDAQEVRRVSSDVVREIIIPELTREVNEGENFSTLRQIYSALLLAAWYRGKVRDSILGEAYLDRNKVSGSEIEDLSEKERIYQQYVEAFRRGAYQFIKEDIDRLSGEPIPRKYFSGGVQGNYAQSNIQRVDAAEVTGRSKSRLVDMAAIVVPTTSKAQNHFPSNFQTIEDKLDARNIPFGPGDTEIVSTASRAIVRAREHCQYYEIPTRAITPSFVWVNDPRKLPFGYAYDWEKGIIYVSRSFDISSFDFFTRKAIFMLSEDFREGRKHEYEFALEKNDREVKRLFPSGVEPTVLWNNFQKSIVVHTGVSMGDLQRQAEEITGLKGIRFSSSSTAMTVNDEILERAKEALFLIGVNALDGIVDYRNPISSREELIKAAKGGAVFAGQLSSKFAPITVAHLVVTILSTYALSGASAFWTNISVFDPRKPEIEKSYEARRESAEKEIESLFDGMVSVLKAEDDFRIWNGEEVFIKMLMSIKEVPSVNGLKNRFVYTAGGDHFYVWSPVDPKADTIPFVLFDPMVEKGGTPEEEAQRRGYYSFYAELLWQGYQELLRRQQEQGERKIFGATEAEIERIAKFSKRSIDDARAEMTARKEFYEAVMAAGSEKELKAIMEKAPFLPRLDTIGKMVLAQAVFVNSEIVMAHTNRPGENYGDLFRDELIKENRISVMNVPGLKGAVAATNTREGLRKFLYKDRVTGERELDFGLLYGNTKPLLQNVFMNRQILELLLRQNKVQTARAIDIMLPEDSEAEGQREDELRAIYEGLGLFIQEEIDNFAESSATVRATYVGQTIEINYSVIGGFDKTGAERNTIVFNRATGDSQGLDLLKRYIHDLNFADAAQTSDAATADAASYGGIDFDLDNLDLDVRSDGSGIRFQIDPAELKNGDFDGLVPVILGVTPITDLPTFLGSREEEEKMAGAV
ncbi:MAG: hypothetical protein GX606_07125, partial [Elusimicrobia bacterium]|nr:hypothetical protein [Elusimicrobiota bacterium]